MYDICRSVSVFNKSKDLSVVILTIPTISTKLCEIRNSSLLAFSIHFHPNPFIHLLLYLNVSVNPLHSIIPPIPSLHPLTTQSVHLHPPPPFNLHKSLQNPFPTELLFHSFHLHPFTIMTPQSQNRFPPHNPFNHPNSLPFTKFKQTPQMTISKP